MKAKLTLWLVVVLNGHLFAGELPTNRSSQSPTNQPLRAFLFDTAGNFGRNDPGYFYYSGVIHMMNRKVGWTQTARGIFRTTDGGETWREVLAAGSHEQMGGYFYDVQNAWVAAVADMSSNVTLLRTSDGGNSWTRTDLCQGHYVQDCILSFPDPNTGWLMLIPDHGMNSMPGDLYRTDDGGANWRLINRTQWHDDYWDPDGNQPGFAAKHPYLLCSGSIAFPNASDGWLLGQLTTTTRAFLFVTRDGGLNWQEKKLPPPPSLREGRIEPREIPHFFGDEGIVGTCFVPKDSEATNFYTVIYDTHDGGETWQPTTPVRFNGVWDFVSARTGWIWSPQPHDTDSTAPVKGTLYRTHDGGETWQAVMAKGLEEYLARGEDIAQLDFVNRQCGWAIAQDSHDFTQLLHTADGGKTWNSIPAKIAQ